MPPTLAWRVVRSRRRSVRGEGRVDSAERAELEPSDRVIDARQIDQDSAGAADGVEYHAAQVVIVAASSARVTGMQRTTSACNGRLASRRQLPPDRLCLRSRKVLEQPRPQVPHCAHDPAVRVAVDRQQQMAQFMSNDLTEDAADRHVMTRCAVFNAIE